MSIALSSLNAATLKAMDNLFSSKPPVLVEVRFPRMGTSSDWYLLDELEELEKIWEKLGPGVELYFQSVWDVRRHPETVSAVKE